MIPDNFETAIPGFSIRFATENDLSLILSFIQGLAEYEKLSDESIVNEEKLAENLFSDHQYAEVLLGFIEGKAVGFALFFHNFSTFLGQPGLYLEDLFVKPEFRGNGYGKALLTTLAKIATERNCGRLEWSVLKWNKPAIEFYNSLKATPMEGWTTYRLDGKQLQELGTHR